MKAIAYTLTAVSALLTVTALVAVLCGVTHQIAMVLIGGLMTYMGAISIREEESDGR